MKKDIQIVPWRLKIVKATVKKTRPHSLTQLPAELFLAQ